MTRHDDPRTVLIYGDSNSHGSPPMPDWNGGPRFGRAIRWPGALAVLLGPAWHVVEEGLPGRTTVHDDPTEGPHRNGLRVLPAVLGSHAPLDLVVVMLGTNDLKDAFGMIPEEIAWGAEKLLRCIAGADCGPNKAAPQMLLISPPPIHEAGCLAGMFAGGAEKSRNLAPHFAAVAARRGAAFLDAAPVVASSPLDGVHLDPGEHAKLAAAVAAKIATLF